MGPRAAVVLLITQILSNILRKKYSIQSNIRDLNIGYVLDYMLVELVI